MDRDLVFLSSSFHPDLQSYSEVLCQDVKSESLMWSECAAVETNHTSNFGVCTLCLKHGMLKLCGTL